MALTEDPHELERAFTPPLPLRNPLRDNAYYQARWRFPEARCDDLTVTSSSPAARGILEEIHRELEDTQQNLVSALYTHQSGRIDLSHTNDLAKSIPGTVTRTSNLRSRSSLAAQRAGLEDHASQASTRSSQMDGLKRHSASLGLGTLPVLQVTEEEKAQHDDFNNTMTRPRSSYDSDESLTTISGYDGAPKLDKDDEEEYAQVEVWLRRGSFTAPPPEFNRTSQSSKARSCPTEKAQPALRIFPPTSRTTGKREYASPLSPLSPCNNGRDCYGNYIPTNTRDYFTTQSPPTSPLRPIMEETHLETQDSVPQLRGGGNWWNTLGIGSMGKEPSLKSKVSTVRPGSSHCGTPIENLRENISVASQDQVPRRFGVRGQGSQISGAPSIFRAGAKDGRSVVTDDWSDESDGDRFEVKTHSQDRSNQFSSNRTHGQHGSDQDKHRELQKRSITTSPGIRPLSINGLQTGRANSSTKECCRFLPIHQSDAPGLDDLWADTFPPTVPISNIERPESPLSRASYAPRMEKRWNTEPATGPPRQEALPPPPPLPRDPVFDPSTSLKKKALFRYNLNNAQTAQEDYRQLASDEHHGNRALSPVILCNHEEWELQSLQLGESVSVAGRAPRYRPTAENDLTTRLKAQAEFRELCHNIMARYNAEISRLNRELQLDRITQEQFENQRRFNIGNKNKALRHSAATTGYMILSIQDEHSILEAMKTLDGYAIYHDLFSNTRPSLWQKLDQQHQLVTAPPTPSYKPRESSFEQARHVAGKLARFILAAPSDPELKTYSNRKPLAVETKPAPAFFSPMGVPIMTGTGSPGGGVWRSKSKKDKGKSRLIGPVPDEAVGTQDFALSNASLSRLTDPTALNSNAHYTGTTAISSAPPILKKHCYSHVPTTISVESSCVASAVSDVSVWPIDDSEGNWYDARRIGDVILRGGGGMERREKNENAN